MCSEGLPRALPQCLPDARKTGTSDDAAGEPQVIKDDSKIVSITDEYEAVDIDLEPAASWTLPLGTLLYYCDGDYAAAMMAPASALHANTLGVLNLGDGSLTTLIEDPIEGTGYAFTMSVPAMACLRGLR